MKGSLTLRLYPSWTCHLRRSRDNNDQWPTLESLGTIMFMIITSDGAEVLKYMKTVFSRGEFDRQSGRGEEQSRCQNGFESLPGRTSWTEAGSLEQKQRSNNTVCNPDFHVTWTFLYLRHYQVQSNSFSLVNKSISYALMYHGPFQCTTCVSKYELTITQNLFLLKMNYQSRGWKCAFNKIDWDE